VQACAFQEEVVVRGFVGGNRGGYFGLAMILTLWLLAAWWLLRSLLPQT